MKSVLISIRPKWCEKIASGEKTIEVRKSAPKKVPFKAYIYETKHATEMPWVDEDGHFIYKGRGQVIGEFICDEVEEFHEWELSPQGKFAEFEEERLEKFLSATCLSISEVVRYRENLPYYKQLYGWHISDLKIYDEPKELSEFYRICKTPCKPSNGKILCITTKSLKMNGCDGKIHLTRPPQSYMFVEEI